MPEFAAISGSVLPQVTRADKEGNADGGRGKTDRSVERNASIYNGPDWTRSAGPPNAITLGTGGAGNSKKAK